jgi:hypothetical protein
MASSLPTSSDYELDFFTAPTSVSPLSIEGTFDSLISATACLSQLKAQLGRWDGVSLRYSRVSRRDIAWKKKLINSLWWHASRRTH